MFNGTKPAISAVHRPKVDAVNAHNRPQPVDAGVECHAVSAGRDPSLRKIRGENSTVRQKAPEVKSEAHISFLKKKRKAPQVTEGGRTFDAQLNSFAKYLLEKQTKNADYKPMRQGI